MQGMTTSTALLLWLLGALIGSMLFFAAGVAPTVFRALPSEQAGRFLRAFFPVYYLWGLVLSLIAALVAQAANPLAALGSAVVATLFVYTRQMLLPQINRARDDDLAGMSEAAQRFKRLHLRSVLINLAQLLILLGICVRLLW